MRHYVKSFVSHKAKKIEQKVNQFLNTLDPDYVFVDAKYMVVGTPDKALRSEDDTGWNTYSALIIYKDKI